MYGYKVWISKANDNRASNFVEFDEKKCPYIQMGDKII